MVKRFFDLIVSLIGLFILVLPMVFFWLLASWDTKSNGIFVQKRIGRYGRPFAIYKLKTLHPKTFKSTALGRLLRKYKIDEWPQLINVLKGDMSLVGPRPDVPGYYDKLQGEAVSLLELRPGITCGASLKYRNEEQLLAVQTNPLWYNDNIIFPDKVKINLEYYNNRSFWVDLQILFRTVLVMFESIE